MKSVHRLHEGPGTVAQAREAELRRVAIERCGPSAAGLDLDADLVMHLGLDSLELLALVAEAERRWGVHIPDEELSRLRTLRQILRAAMEETR